MLLVIDNYDSFVYNLVQYLGELGFPTQVFRNDKISLNQVKEEVFEAVILSPGPCTPNEAGICLELIEKLSPVIPMFGVCLGHQAIAQSFGGKVTRADKILHGKTSTVIHDGRTIFSGLKNPLTVTRYHSLIIKEEHVPSCFEISARTNEKEVMAIRHKDYLLEGVQFHPEAILTEQGHQILKNFMRNVELRKVV